MKLPISKLRNNTGQVDGVPANPRSIDKADYAKLLKSIQEDPKYVDVIRKRYHKFVTGSDEGWEDGTPRIGVQ